MRDVIKLQLIYKHISKQSFLFDPFYFLFHSVVDAADRAAYSPRPPRPTKRRLCVCVSFEAIFLFLTHLIVCDEVSNGFLFFALFYALIFYEQQ